MTLLIVAIILALMIAGFLVYHSAFRYKPDSVESISVMGKGKTDTVPGCQLGFYTWNIGYAGLGKEMDFFYEGGKMVRPDKVCYIRYRNGILNQLTTLHHADFMLLQEVDTYSARSYRENQVNLIATSLPGYAMFFALNYKVGFVPLPVRSPMGTVESGILTLSGINPVAAQRFAFPSHYSWPKRLFMLNRCFLVTRYNTSKGYQLVVVNTHNSAFDDAAEMRVKELKMLKEFMIRESGKGNYVVVGGDWNQNPVPYDHKAIIDGNKAYSIIPPIPPDFLPEGWMWVYDPARPSNRNVNVPFSKGKTGTTIIDFFVISPNIELKTVHTVESGFAYSDHQPVGMIVELK